MHHHTELSFVDEFWWVSPIHYLNGWQNAVLRWCMLQAVPPYLHYYCAVVLHSCTLLPHVDPSSNHEYHCCQLTRQSSCVSNFYRTFYFFIWLSLVEELNHRLSRFVTYSIVCDTYDSYVKTIFNQWSCIFYILWRNRCTRDNSCVRTCVFE